MTRFAKGGRSRGIVLSGIVSLVIAIATLAALEIFLRVADFRELREGVSERSLSYRYDSELGWAAVPGSSSTVTNVRTIHAQHNSLGLRDIEFGLDARPTIMFLGDVPEPTERLVSKIRDFVEAKGAKFLVGLQYSDPALIRHLQASRIPFVTFDGAAFYPGASAGAHWTPEGHKLVAERVLGLLSDNNIVPGEIRAPK
jgi:hypothetical protein